MYFYNQIIMVKFLTSYRRRYSLHVEQSKISCRSEKDVIRDKPDGEISIVMGGVLSSCEKHRPPLFGNIKSMGINCSAKI
jgi:hypothetical protein